MSEIHVNPTLYTGRPQPEGRLPKELAVYDLLDALRIPYERVDHERADTVECCRAVEAVLGISICKNLFLCNRQKTDFYLLLMPGDKPFKTKDLSSQIGSARLSFGEPCYLEEFLNVTPGSVSILGLMNDQNHRVRLLLDREVAESAYVGVHPCINTTSLRLKTSDLLEKFLPHTGHIPRLVTLSYGDAAPV